MGTRDDWSSYKLEDGLNIWGDPEFQGSPVLAGGFTFGDAVADTLVIKGRMATMTVAGGYVEIPSTYTYIELIELRSKVTDWTGVGSQFQTLYIRNTTDTDATGKTMRAAEFLVANDDNIDVGSMEALCINPMGKGNSAIGLMKGMTNKIEWLATDVVAVAKGLELILWGAAAPTEGHGLIIDQSSYNLNWDDAIQIKGTNFNYNIDMNGATPRTLDIRLAAGMGILSGSGAPTVAAPKGTLYLRTDGSGVADRAYINTDGSTTWTNLTTAA